LQPAAGTGSPPRKRLTARRNDCRALVSEIKVESITGGLGVSDRWIQQRPDQIKKVITGIFKGMAHARANRQESIELVMSKWKLEREVAEKAFDLVLRTWSENGLASDQGLQIGIEKV